MKKYLILILINFLLIQFSRAQSLDTLTAYYATLPNGSSAQVAGPDQADFIRIILPPDPGENKVNVKEFYKNGVLKFVGKYEADYMQEGKAYLTGTCIYYSPTGKKSQITNFANGYKQGDEYLYYPDGKIYSRSKFETNSLHFTYRWYLECYDRSGTQICTEGNGLWILYDEKFENKSLEGTIKKARFEGDWHGETHDSEPVKYIYRYKNGLFISGTGFDKNGIGYPFFRDIEAPQYKKSIFTFVDIIRNKVKLIKRANFNPDTAKFSFIIEKDGSVSQPKIVGLDDSVSNKQLSAALEKFKGWEPRRYYGIPLRTQLTLPFRELFQFNEQSHTLDWRKSIQWNEKILGY